MKDFLGSTTLTLEDIHRVSTLDASQSCQLQGVRTGVVEIKVKVISEESKVSLGSYPSLSLKFIHSFIYFTFRNPNQANQPLDMEQVKT
jgi:hypothetical protein